MYKNILQKHIFKTKKIRGGILDWFTEFIKLRYIFIFLIQIAYRRST